MVTRRKTEAPEAAIVRLPGLRGGSPTIAGTGIRVLDVVRYRRMHKKSPLTRILKALPHLTLAQVETALRYYEDHRGDIDREINEEEALIAEWPSTPRSTSTRTST